MKRVLPFLGVAVALSAVVALIAVSLRWSPVRDQLRKLAEEVREELSELPEPIEELGV